MTRYQILTNARVALAAAFAAHTSNGRLIVQLLSLHKRVMSAWWNEIGV